MEDFDMLPQHLIETLETPCVVIDERIAKQNIERMQAVANENGCKLRPHIKTHKIPYFAHLQLQNGPRQLTNLPPAGAEIAHGDCQSPLNPHQSPSIPHQPIPSTQVFSHNLSNLAF